MKTPENTPAHDLASVRAHYDQLSVRYRDDSNQVCRRAYEALTREVLSDAQRVLELGAGPSPALSVLSAPVRVASDLSREMLRANPHLHEAVRLVADAQCLPFATGAFDAIFCVNVLEHVPDPGQLIREAARILSPGGLFFGITPNGGTGWILELLERLRLKLPEGPHRFLDYAELGSMLPPEMTMVRHRRFLAFPAGPDALVRGVDRLFQRGQGEGLFHYVLMRKDR